MMLPCAPHLVASNAIVSRSRARCHADACAAASTKVWGSRGRYSQAANVTLRMEACLLRALAFERQGSLTASSVSSSTTT